MRRGFSGRAQVVKTGAGGFGFGLGEMPQAFLSGSLTISNGYVGLPANFELSSFEGSEEPLAVKVCDGAILRLQDITTVVSVPLDLAIEGSGKIDFPYAGSSYNRGLVVARTLATNGVALPPGRYTTAHGFVTGGSTACSVVVPVTWTGAGDGEAWHDPANWAGGSVPNGTTAVADLSNARGDVRLDGPVTLTCLVYNSQGAQRGLTLTGNGALTLHVPVIVSPCLFVGPGRTLTLDVPFSRTPDGGSLAITGGGSIQVNKGFPGIGGGQGASFSLNGQLVFSGNLQMGNTFLGLWRHELNGQATVVFTNGCQLTCQRILNNPSGFYALNQVLHDGGTVTCGDVFFTRHNGNSVSPYTYFMRSGTLTTTNANGISLGVHYTSAWTRYSGGSFVMSGGTVNTARFAMGMPDNMIDLNGGEVNLGSGGIISTTNIQGTVRLGGVALCAAANWSSSLNMELSGENGPTVLDTQGRTVTLSGALSGLGGLVKTGSGTLTLSGATNTFAGPLVVSGGTLVCGATSVFNGVTDLVVTNGTLNVDGDVLSSGMTVRVGGTGALLVAAGKELVVERLYLNNTLRPAGSYTFGEGTVTVFPYAGIVWTGGAHDGALWSTLGNWANTASVPNGSDVQLDLGFSQFEASDQIVLDVTPGVALAGLTFDQGAPGCTLTVTCPGAVTNTLTFAADGTVCVAEGQTLVLDTDVFMNGHLFKTGLGTLVLDRNVASASAAGDFRLYIREGRVVNRGSISRMAVQPANASRLVPPPEYVQEGSRAVMQNRVFALPGYWTGVNAERGVFVQRGGVVDLTTPSVQFFNAGVGFMIAGGSGTEGRYVLEGGELITCPTWPAYVSGNYARGVFCQSGGTSMFYRLTLSMPVTTGGFGEVLLSNGTLRVNGTVTKGNSGGRVELSGGRVEVLSDGAVFAEDVPVTLA
ncbi:MAG: autotransporter-associated beta strand repeat-containing protein, partial [Kiritimatiellia bacterium]